MMKSQLFTIAIAAFVALLSYARSYANEAKSEQQMNVLFLASDDLNSWLLGDTNRYAGKVVAPKQAAHQRGHTPEYRRD